MGGNLALTELDRQLVVAERLATVGRSRSALAQWKDPAREDLKTTLDSQRQTSTQEVSRALKIGSLLDIARLQHH